MKYKLSQNCLVIFILLSNALSSAEVIMLDTLADHIKQMESAIIDISLEYEWRIIPPSTHEEVEEQMGVEVLISKDGYKKAKLSAARLLPQDDPNAKDWNNPGQFLLDESFTLLTRDGNSWEAISKQSYDGQIAKELNVGGWPSKRIRGSISLRRPHVYGTGTPFGFTVLSFAYFAEPMPLSDRLLSTRLRAKDKVHLDNVVKKIDGFNTIRADLLTDFLYEGNRLVYMRIHFSVDHGYTPVKFEYMKGRGLGALSVNVETLEEVAEGLWFPDSGTITDPDSDQVSAYQAISPILVNQGLTDEHFDIDFPVGTKVHDEIQDRKYTVK